MSQFFQLLGGVIFAAWIAGNLGVIDFRLCIEEPGGCSAPAAQAKAQEGE